MASAFRRPSLRNTLAASRGRHPVAEPGQQRAGRQLRLVRPDHELACRPLQRPFGGHRVDGRVETHQRRQRVGAGRRVRHVPAQRAHIPDLRRADGVAGIDEQRRGLPDQRRLDDLCERGCRANGDHVARAADFVQVGREGDIHHPVARSRSRSSRSSSTRSVPPDSTRQRRPGSFNSATA